MRRLKYIALAPLTIAAASVMTPGCQSSDCLDLRSSIPSAGFYAYYNLTPISLDSLSVGGIGAVGDSLLLKAGTPTQQMYLPIRSAVPSTSFCIHYGYRGLDSENMNDTITLSYESIPYFVSQECGAMYRYRITAIDHTCHLIDSVGCSDSLITNIDIERLQIYFRIAPEDTPQQPDEISLPKGGAR